MRQTEKRQAAPADRTGTIIKINCGRKLP